MRYKMVILFLRFKIFIEEVLLTQQVFLDLHFCNFQLHAIAPGTMSALPHISTGLVQLLHLRERRLVCTFHVNT